MQHPARKKPDSSKIRSQLLQSCYATPSSIHLFGTEAQAQKTSFYLFLLKGLTRSTEPHYSYIFRRLAQLVRALR
ncbi:hypothetical protein ACFOEM_05960 [Paenalcaligenes hominis]|uniref:hypothetical protein n=1 Tax=Paenalcaligenes hominis TaxID=643674 RepID=UPI003620F430